MEEIKLFGLYFEKVRETHDEDNGFGTLYCADVDGDDVVVAIYENVKGRTIDTCDECKCTLENDDGLHFRIGIVPYRFYPICSDCFVKADYMSDYDKEALLSKMERIYQISTL